jgi:hypothetical protein
MVRLEARGLSQCSADIDMHSQAGTERPGEPHRMPAAWVRAAVLFGAFLLIGATGFLTVLSLEESNPRRIVMTEGWGAVREHESTAEALVALGRPDKDETVHDVVDGRYTCVRELTWYTWPDEQSGKSYHVCLDAANIVRRKSEGMAFNLRTW